MRMDNFRFRSVFLSLAIISTISITAYGAIPFKPGNDTMILGKGANLIDKSITFDVGDGVTNPVLKIDDTLKIFDFSKDLESSGNNIKVGDGTNSDKFLSFKISGEEVGFKFDSLTGELLHKKKPGETYKKLGTGAGGGAGGLNNLLNGNFEDGFNVNWSNVGGVFNKATPIYEGETSAAFQGITAGNTVCSTPRVLLDGLYGNSGEARIYYFGGDENYTLKIINGDSLVIAEQVLKNHPTYSQESIFLGGLPKLTDTLNERTLQLCIEHTSASLSTSMDLDEMYLGRLIDLAETTLPDKLTAHIDQTGSIVTTGVTWLTVNLSGSDYIIDYSSLALTEIPSLLAGQSTVGVVNDRYGSFYNVTTSGAILRMGAASGGSATDVDISFELNKQGSDAKQTVQVYKSIPRIADITNELSAKFLSDGTVDSEKVDFINGDCTNPSAGIFDCLFNANEFSVSPSMQVTCNDPSDRICAVTNLTATGFTIRTRNTTALANVAFNINVSRQTTDVKALTVQPIVVGQVVNSYAETASKNVRVESCKILNPSGVPSTSSDICDSWIESLTHIGLGVTGINIKSGIFPFPPICVSIVDRLDRCSSYNNIAPTTSEIQIRTATCSTNSVEDVDIYIICSGKR